MKSLGIALFVMSLPFNAVADDHPHKNMSQGSTEIHQSMERSSKKMSMMKMSGEVDRDFARVMADHHRAGVEMARIYAKYGKEQELVSMATKMIGQQEKEIEELERHAE